MNELSWFLYWADVVPSLGTAVQLIFFLLGIGFGILFVVFLACHIDGYGYGNRKYLPGKYPISAVFAFFLCLVIWFGTFLVPSRETIYMIAASEAGEMVVTSPEAREMLNDLKAIIKGYIPKEIVK